MGVPHGTPKSSTLIGFSLINHPFWGTPIYGNPHVLLHHHSQARPPGAPQRLHAVSAGSLLLRKGPQVEADALLVKPFT